MGKEEIECMLSKTYSHPVLSVTAIMLPLPLCACGAWRMRALTLPCTHIDSYGKRIV